MNWKYIAGFFDGEGSVGWYGKDNKNPRITISQKNDKVLFKIKEFLLKEKIRSGIANKDSKEIVTQLFITRRKDVESFLKNIIPHLIVKKRGAERVLDLVLKTNYKTRYSIEEEEKIMNMRNKENKSFNEIAKVLKRKDRSSVRRAYYRLSRKGGGEI